FSWNPGSDGKMAIRGSYGTFFDRAIGATASAVDAGTPGFSQPTPIFPNSSGTGDLRVADGIPLPPQPPAPVLTLAATRAQNITIMHPNLRTGYVHQYSLNVQKEMLRNTVFDIGYVGARGVKLFMDLNVNQRKIAGDFLQSFKEMQAFAASGVAPPANNTFVRMFGTPAAAVTALSATNLSQGLTGPAADNLDRTAANYNRYASAGQNQFFIRNFPQYNQVILGTNDGRNYFDSLQFSVRRRAGAFSLYANYTFSKSMDNISVDGNGFTSPIDSFNLGQNRARGDADRPHAFNMAASYTLPIGRGHALGGNMPRWVDTLVGGWDLGVLNVWQSGSVMTVSSGRQTTGSSANTWANFSGDRNIGSVDRRSNGTIYYLATEQIAGFTFPGAGEVGSSGRNTFRGPRFFGVDMSLVKKFKLTERHTIAFRAEGYNVFNQVNFANPAVSIATPQTFGRISGTVGQPRIFQMAMRYDF
ncbi:MAG: TonB-dependent receptor, partial [Bryobacteraceae bacterium]